MNATKTRLGCCGSLSTVVAVTRGVCLCLAILAIWSPALSADPVFSAAETETCVTDITSRSPGMSGHAVLDCVGRSAQACMMRPGGDTTIGMIDCLGAEAAYWDTRMTAAHVALMAESARADAEIAQMGSSAASRADALQDMQQAWTAYRDATCFHEQTLWQGGSGAGPATMACHMHETGRHALKLEGWWQQ